MSCLTQSATVNLIHHYCDIGVWTRMAIRFSERVAFVDDGTDRFLTTLARLGGYCTVEQAYEMGLAKSPSQTQALLNGLDADRFWGRFYKAPALARVLRQLVDYANTTGGSAPLSRDPVVRRRLAAIAADIAALRLIFYRTGCLIRDGAPLTYETAMAKVYADETGQKLARFGMDLLGVWGPLREGSRWAKLGGQISHLYLTTLGHTIAGGTAEILRTSIAVRGLGLPAEPRAAAEPKAR